MKKGFTLLELLLVLALIGLLTGVIMPRLGGSLSGIKLRSAANKVAAMMRYARNQAVTEQVPCQIVFDRPGNLVFFEVAESAEGESSPSIEKKIYNLPEEVKIAGIKGGIETGTKDTARFLFNPGGSSSGGEIVLAGGNRSYRIELDRITGLVEVD